ncbi:hypothetical protein [Kitasatospora sp. NPDC056731]|uniref:hypothetical protein n=1 Tax=Kitasatospora sp. NPDC056731 TaxID=3155422 RepID=UPI003424F4B2
MTRAERLAILGAATVAEIHHRVEAAPPPTPELIAELRPVLAPALQRVRARRTASEQQVLPLAA